MSSPACATASPSSRVGKSSPRAIIPAFRPIPPSSKPISAPSRPKEPAPMPDSRMSDSSVSDSATASGKPAAALLSVADLHGFYGESHILHGVNFDIRPGEVVTLLGRNGAGKTTTLKAIMGMLTKRMGSIRFEGRETVGLTSDRIAR